jgi:hypothetical protein
MTKIFMPTIVSQQSRYTSIYKLYGKLAYKLAQSINMYKKYVHGK